VVPPPDITFRPDQPPSFSPLVTDSAVANPSPGGVEATLAAARATAQSLRDINAEYNQLGEASPSQWDISGTPLSRVAKRTPSDDLTAAPSSKQSKKSAESNYSPVAFDLDADNAAEDSSAGDISVAESDGKPPSMNFDDSASSAESSSNYSVFPDRPHPDIGNAFSDEECSVGSTVPGGGVFDALMHDVSDSDDQNEEAAPPVGTAGTGNYPATPEEGVFYSHKDFIDTSSAVCLEEPEGIMAEEELLIQLVKEENLPPRVYNRIMQWAKYCSERRYNFNGPRYQTVMKRMIQHYANDSLKHPVTKIVRMDWQSKPTRVPTFDPLPQINALLNDSELMEGALWNYFDQRDPDGNKIYGDVNTGKLWERAEQAMRESVPLNDPNSQCHHICPFFVFDDNTLADGIGRLQVQPVLATLWILNSKSRRKVKGWFLLGIVPPYPRTSQERKEDRNQLATKLRYLEWYHACLDKILEPLILLSKRKEGVPFRIGEEHVILHFDMGGLIGDTSGHDDMVCHYHSYSANIAKMNRDCSIPQDQGDDPYYECTRTISDELKEIVLESIENLKLTGKGSQATRTAARKLLQSHSQHPLLSTYWKFGFFGDPEGPHGCSPYEILHAWYLGMMKLGLQASFNITHVHEKLVDWYKKRLKGHKNGDLANRPSTGGAKNAVAFPKAEMEARMRFLTSCSRRQSDRSMPRAPFREGVTDLSRLNGQEYPGLCLLSSVCFKGIFHGVKAVSDLGDEFAADLEQRLCLVVFLSLSLEVQLTAEHISEKERELLEERMKLFLDFFRKTLGVYIESGSQTGLRRSKYHAPIHIVADLIPKYGSTMNFFGGFLESFLKFLVKQPIARTSRKHQHYQMEILGRYLEETVVRASKERLGQNGISLEAICSVNDEASVPTNYTWMSTAVGEKKFRVGAAAFFCKQDPVSKKWSTYDSEGNVFAVDSCAHVGYGNNEEANSWVASIVEFAETTITNGPSPSLEEMMEGAIDRVDRVDFYYYVRTPSLDVRYNDAFRCHPNYHGSTNEIRPWHDWATVQFNLSLPGEAPDLQNGTSKILLWGIVRDTRMEEHATKSGVSIETKDKRLVAATRTMPPWALKRDETLYFARTGILDEAVDVIDFTAIQETAYVLPINNTREDPFPTCNEQVEAYCVLPPRSTWKDIGWDHPFLNEKNISKVNRLSFL